MSVPENVILSGESPWPSPHSGWYTNKRDITPYDGPPIAASDITRQSIRLAIFRNAQAVEEGFEVALLEMGPSSYAGRAEKLVLDPSGELYRILQKEDKGDTSDVYTRITRTLTPQVLRLPLTGRFRNTWAVQHTRTCQANDILYLPQEARSNAPDSEPWFKQTTVYGYVMPTTDSSGGSQSRESLPLSKQVGEYTTLPRELDELFGLALEAGKYQRGEVNNERLIDAIRNIVKEGNV